MAFSSCSRIVTSQASYAANCVFRHGSSGAGENLYATSDVNVGTPFALMNAVDLWYKEISQYNFNAGQFSGATGHFTQLVWKASNQVGCAAQVCSQGIGGTSWSQGIFVVCRYTPPGNVIGRFRENVLPPVNNNPPPPATPVPPGTLPSGYRFASPGCLASASNAFKFCLMDDGQIMVFNPSNTLTWNADVSPSPGATKPFYVTLDRTGNLFGEWKRGNRHTMHFVMYSPYLPLTFSKTARPYGLPDTKRQCPFTGMGWGSHIENIALAAVASAADMLWINQMQRKAL
eukprot:gene5869-6110_t